MTRQTKRQKAHVEETERASEPDLAGALELSDQKLKTNTIHRPGALMR